MRVVDFGRQVHGFWSGRTTHFDADASHEFWKTAPRRDLRDAGALATAKQLPSCPFEA